MHKVVQGHRLRTNQYIVVRIYDDEAAAENWDKAVIKTQTETQTIDPTKEITKVDDTSSDDVGSESKDGVEETTVEAIDLISITDVKSEDLSIGQLYIIKGTDVSFYIPPTGVEVVPEEGGSYIREAVTLEQLDYCVLLDENGKKDYRRGPDVIFPNPTQAFMTSKTGNKQSRKFKAIQLNEISGLYIKVIAPYTSGEKSYKEGDELFITGKDQMIYFPRPEHSIIKYGEQEVHFAVAIPKGEARYVLNRTSGEIKTVKGPNMLLPDPRNEVIVKRILNYKEIQLLYPGNNEALQYNAQLEQLRGPNKNEFVTNRLFEQAGNVGKSRGMGPDVEATFASISASKSAYSQPEWTREQSEEGFVGDIHSPRTTFTKPRTITIDSKYDGAVKVQIWTGYAVLVVDGEGKRKVAVGPAKFNLDYDHTLEKIIMSTGKPKTTDQIREDVYLRVKNNKVADIITAETSDLVNVSIKVSYRLNFVGEPEKWFDVENYVKFLCDHMRSLVKGKIQTMTINEFYGKSIEIIRGIILNHDHTHAERKEDEEAPMKGRFFEENGMHVYDVEVLKASISDEDLAYELSNTQSDIVMGTIKQKKEETLLALETKTNEIAKKRITLSVDLKKSNTQGQLTKMESDQQVVNKNNELAIKAIEANKKGQLAEAAIPVELKQLQLNAELGRQNVMDAIAEAIQQRKDNEAEAMLAIKTNADAQLLETLKEKKEIEAIFNKATAEDIVKQLKSIQPGLIEALQSLAQVHTVSNIMPSLVPLSIVEGKNVGNTLVDLLGTTAAGKIFDKFSSNVISQETDTDLDD
jgi:major vault protein